MTDPLQVFVSLYYCNTYYLRNIYVINQIIRKIRASPLYYGPEVRTIFGIMLSKSEPNSKLKNDLYDGAQSMISYGNESIVILSLVYIYQLWHSILPCSILPQFFPSLALQYILTVACQIDTVFSSMTAVLHEAYHLLLSTNIFYDKL